MFTSFSSPAFRLVNLQTNARTAQQQALTFAGKTPKTDRYKGIPKDQVEILKTIEKQALTLHDGASTHTLRSADGENGNSSVHKPTVNRVFSQNGKLRDAKGIIQSAKDMYEDAFGANGNVSVVAALGWLRDALNAITKVPRAPQVEKQELELERQIFPEELPKQVTKSAIAIKRGQREMRKTRVLRESGGQGKNQMGGSLRPETISQSNALTGLKEAYAYQQDHPVDSAAGEALKAAQKKFRKAFNIPDPRKAHKTQVVMIGDQEIPIS